MPFEKPPDRFTASPAMRVLPAGTALWRVHDAKYRADSFNPTATDMFYGGSRFDSTGLDPYGFLYAAPEQSTCLAEVLLRGLGFDRRGARTITREKVKNRCISRIEVTKDLNMVSLLSTPELAAVCQDEWLIQAWEHDYPQTRNWGHWIRAQASWAHGMIWLSKRDLPLRAAVFFGDHCPADALRADLTSSIRLDDAAGAGWLNEILAPYRVRVRPPR